MLSRIKIATKIPLYIVAASIIGSAAAGIIAERVAARSLQHMAEEELLSVASSKADTLNTYLNSITEDLQIIASSQTLKDAARDFNRAWDELGDDKTRYLQDAYIHNNPHPIGKKNALNAANDGSAYSEAHGQYHPWLNQFLETRGYYDIFILNRAGDLVYSVFKELDYATNLQTDEWKESDLGNIFRRTIASEAKQGDILFEDFEPYGPSSNAPAAFIATPIYRGDSKVGVLVFQMPIERINAITGNHKGLGDEGEAYLVGADGLLRSQSRFVEKSILKSRVDNAALVEGLDGKEGVVKNVVNYRNETVYSSYQPIQFHGTKWVMLADMTTEQINAPLKQLTSNTLQSVIISLILVAVVGWYLAGGITRPMARINRVLDDIAEDKLDTEIAYGDRKDEIGDLARAAIIFKQNAIEKHKFEAAQKEAEIRAAEEKKKAQHELAGKFEQRVQGIISTVASASTELHHTAESMGNVIQNVNTRVTSVSGASQSATHSVNSVAAASEEMSATVREIAQQIARSVQAVREAMGNVNKASATSQELEQSANKIGEIVVLIQSIASQINLLALNATIESARAGEAGKGFAVVAGEVKALATQTSKATDQIASYIQSIQGVSAQMVEVLESVQTSMGHVDEYSTAMSAAVEEQSAATNEIASNMVSAASVTEQINGDIQEVSQATLDASASASQVLDAAKTLSQEAEALNHAVHNFLDEIRNA